ncbi:MAG TPA: hypothetical protein VMW10_05050 [Alphaproteobacteria bacterium]|nr:hypothetical protein [Alphaproteobacteria bacterium]
MRIESKYPAVIPPRSSDRTQTAQALQHLHGNSIAYVNECLAIVMAARLSGAGDGRFRSDPRLQTAVQRAIVSNIFPTQPWQYTRIRPQTTGLSPHARCARTRSCTGAHERSSSVPHDVPLCLGQRPVSFATKVLFPFGVFVVFFTKPALLSHKVLIKKH